MDYTAYISSFFLRASSKWTVPLEDNGRVSTGDRNLQGTIREVGYSMRYVSRLVNTSAYPNDFKVFVNANLTRVADDLRNVGLPVILAETVFSESAPTPSPTAVPTPTPTTDRPSFTPTVSPYSIPPSEAPSSFPTQAPSDPINPDSEGGGGGGGINTTIVAAASVGGGAVLLVALFVYYRRRKRKKERDYQAAAAGGGLKPKSKNGSSGGSKRGEAPVWGKGGLLVDDRDGDSGMGLKAVDADAFPNERSRSNSLAKEAPDEFNFLGTKNNGTGDMLQSNDSLESNQSLISAPYSMSSESDTEVDTTHNLADEFDKYKDQNLEKMRTEVEGNLTNFDGMMSQALTKALMDDEDSTRDMTELMWGGTGEPMEIEASVLCEMNDWLKRKENASVDERRAFMQETLNKMVASVRHGIIAPEEASRTIHECAAMLGLQLVEDIPETALIVTGMRKMVERRDVIDAFKEFGEIEDAAVSPNARGFGLVRYKSPRSVQRAMERFRTGEIVVQDVAVMIKVLKSDARASRAPVQPAMPVPETDLNRQYSGDPRRGAAMPPPPSAPPRATPAPPPNLNTAGVGFLGETTLERAESRGTRAHRGPGSDTGSHTSARSRTSNKSNHSRTTTSEGRNGKSKRRNGRETTY